MNNAIERVKKMVRSDLFNRSRTTGIACSENTLVCQPHIVRIGAQKNFAGFARRTGKR